MRIIPRATYDCTGLQANTSSYITLAQHIDASVFQEADLLVRFHPSCVLQSGASAFVALVPDGYDFDDPAAVGAASAAGFITFPTSGPGVVHATSSTTMPAMFMTTLGQSAGPFARLLAVTMVVQQGTVSGAQLSLFISADLILKGGDPSLLPMMPNGYRGYRII
jgi:hypothetical protein